jgi:hypothetical protein
MLPEFVSASKVPSTRIFHAWHTILVLEPLMPANTKTARTRISAIVTMAATCSVPTVGLSKTKHLVSRLGDVPLIMNMSQPLGG